MGRGLTVITTILLVGASLATVASGQDLVAFQSVEASVDFELLIDASPTPVCWHYWDWQAEGTEIPPLDQGHESVGGNCTSGWSMHADTTGLFWHGWWPEIDPDNGMWNIIMQDARLECRIHVREPARLRASRTVSGVLSVDIHTVEVVPVNADPIVMLAEGAGPHDADLELAEGLYTIVLRGQAVEHGTHGAHAATVHLAWEATGGTAVDQIAWSAVKALFRHH